MTEQQKPDHPPYIHPPFVCFFGVYAGLTRQRDLNGLEHWQLRELVHLRDQFLHTYSFHHIAKSTTSQQQDNSRSTQPPYRVEIHLARECGYGDERSVADT